MPRPRAAPTYRAGGSDPPGRGCGAGAAPTWDPRGSPRRRGRRPASPTAGPRVAEAKFPRLKRLADFDTGAWTHPPSHAGTPHVGAYLDAGEPVVMLGDSGTGKTHLLIGLGLAACEQADGCGTPPPHSWSTSSSSRRRPRLSRIVGN